ncbi:MAG: phage major capsid protein [Bacteroidaceae bacterium]|nr:phage major capsid protein [Bacteroidaceae bacterium]
MDYNFKQAESRMRELNNQLKAMASADENYNALEREFNNVKREYEMNLNLRNREASEPMTLVKSPNEQFREIVMEVRAGKRDGELNLRDATNAITSAVIQSGEKTNMVSAGLPVENKPLVEPLEMDLIYNLLGIQVATGVRGALQWPCLDTSAEVTVGGELDAVGDVTLDFSKITATPYKLGISIAVSNEAINDASFDLLGTVATQINKAVGRTLNKRILMLTTPVAKPGFVGPLKDIAVALNTESQNRTDAQDAIVAAQTESFATPNAPTYKEIKALKGKVLKTGAQMSGFCYVMDAAMFSTLEATSKDTGSGTFVIENGKIDGAPVFLTADPAYAGVVAAGCFGYVALNQHGNDFLVIDPYTGAKNNKTLFIYNADFSLTTIKSEPFAIGK